MEQNQDQQRQSAAQEFQASLHQLEDILQENSAEAEVVTAPLQLEEDLTPIDLEALEEAVADIEQYLEEKKK
ncbi:MAG: hypothetical protein KME23_05810 [Goleter apudmare HA4340-LM2]|jgi:UDP-N-acetyl-D-mannosaminuronate dehydrogenase|nr:hypothetical protein [Goleter apudmare HA4340-LM2]